jgi:hypothetical protein
MFAREISVPAPKCPDRHHPWTTFRSKIQSELEALEIEADLKAARATLANPGECITIDELEKRLVTPFPSGRG